MPVFKIKQNGEWINIAGGSGGGEIPDNLVYVSEENQESAVVPLDADTLGGYTVNSLIDKIYPVGSIYMSVNAVSPATLFGGTWEALKDRFLIGAGEYTAAGSTGGEATHTLTVDEMPKHEHKISTKMGSYDASGTIFARGSSWATEFDSNDGSAYPPIIFNATGGSQPHNNIPPYLSVYMWKRTA